MSLPSKYKQVASLGEGHFAIVTEYFDTTTKLSVAIKRLKKKNKNNEMYQTRFRREIEITASLSDVEGVIDILEKCAENSYYCMAKANDNLLKYIRTNNDKLHEDDRIEIIRQICSTMSTAHERGIIHRDLSPTNILQIENESNTFFQIADFGLGKTDSEIKGLSTNSSVSNYGQALYVSPEQREKLKSATMRSDVYSLGKLIDFIMTGRDPDNARQHVLKSISTKACEYEPVDRFSDAGELLVELDKISELLTESVGSISYTANQLDLAASQQDWKSAHKTIATQSFSGHNYENYVEPVTEFLENTTTRDEYANAIGDLINDTANRYLIEVEPLSSMVGWPFNQRYRFYRVMSWLFSKVTDDQIKTNLFMAIWSEAYDSDQWDTQDVAKNLLGSFPNDRTLQIQIARAIEESGGESIQQELLNFTPDGPITNIIRKFLSARNSK